MLDWSKYCGCIYDIYKDMINTFGGHEKKDYEKKDYDEVHDDWSLMG